MVKVTKNEELLLFRKDLKHRSYEVEQVRVLAPLVSEGFIKFYKLEHGWTCGHCSERVTIAKFRHHVHKAHSSY